MDDYFFPWKKRAPPARMTFHTTHTASPSPNCTLVRDCFQRSCLPPTDSMTVGDPLPNPLHRNIYSFRCFRLGDTAYDPEDPDSTQLVVCALRHRTH